MRKIELFLRCRVVSVPASLLLPTRLPPIKMSTSLRRSPRLAAASSGRPTLVIQEIAARRPTFMEPLSPTASPRAVRPVSFGPRPHRRISQRVLHAGLHARGNRLAVWGEHLTTMNRMLERLHRLPSDGLAFRRQFFAMYRWAMSDGVDLLVNSRRVRLQLRKKLREYDARRSTQGLRALRRRFRELRGDINDYTTNNDEGLYVPLG